MAHEIIWEFPVLKLGGGGQRKLDKTAEHTHKTRSLHSKGLTNSLSLAQGRIYGEGAGGAHPPS